MSFMFEVLFEPSSDPQREAVISDRIGQFGGRLTFREEPDAAEAGPVCLTYEFGDLEVAHQAASSLRSRGEHVEGPVEYGEEG